MEHAMKVNILGTTLSPGMVSEGFSIGVGKIDYNDSNEIKALHMEFKEDYSQDARDVYSGHSLTKTLYVLVQDENGNSFELSGSTVSMYSKGYTLKVSSVQKI